MENKQKTIKLKDLLITIILLLIIIATNTFFVSLNLHKIEKKLDNYSNTKEEKTTSAKSIDITPYVVSDLTGTTWEFNDFIYIDIYDFDYSITFINNNNTFTSIYTTYGSKTYRLYYNNLNVCSLSERNYVVSWADVSYKTISITGGTDATNSNLISWLETNATMQQTTTQLTTPTITKTAYNQISWSAISNASGYAIYKDNVQLTTTNNTSYTATALGTYQVMAIGDNVNYSDSSLSNSITLTATQLATPQTTINGGIMSWQAITNATGYDIYKDNTLIQSLSMTNLLYNITTQGNYQVKATSNNVFFTNSELSTAIVTNKYNITYKLSNLVITSNKPNEIWTSQTITLTMEAYNNYNLPQYISVTGAQYNYTQSTGTLIIYNATNDVTIEIQAEYKSGQYTMADLLDSVIIVPVNTFYSMFNFELLGINLYSLLLGALTLFLIIKIYLKVFKN